MEPIWLLLLLPLAAASGWWMASKDREESTPNRDGVPEAFFKGLNLLLNEQPDKALSVFLEVENLDQDMVEMHVAMGNLFRRRGDIEKATQIHQNLVARTDIDDSLRTMALFELAQDYFKAGLFDRSEGLFQELRQSSDYEKQACKFLLQIYDQEKEWHSAIVVAEELSSLDEQDYSEPLAQYCCELAERAISEGKLGQAEYYLESAFKYDVHNPRAIILSGQVKAKRGNHRSAISTWSELDRWAPEALGEVVTPIKQCFEALEDQNGYRQFLEHALEKNPDARIIAELVSLTRSRKGKIAGQRLLIDIVKKYPNLEGLYQLMRHREAPELLRGESLDLELIARLLMESMGHAKEYHCRQCGFASNALHWQCPGCKEWGSVQKRSFGREQISKEKFISP